MPTPLPPAEDLRLRRTIRVSLIVFIVGLVLSGLTAFPLRFEIDLLARMIGATGSPDQYAPGGLQQWIATVHTGVVATDDRYPFVFYGTDWLAFGHLTIALFFFGPLRDPVRNVFVLRVGLLACALVWPLTLICGPIRGIPFGWRLIDGSFGIFGAIPLLIALRATQRLELLDTRFHRE